MLFKDCWRRCTRSTLVERHTWLSSSTPDTYDLCYHGGLLARFHRSGAVDLVRCDCHAHMWRLNIFTPATIFYRRKTRPCLGHYRVNCGGGSIAFHPGFIVAPDGTPFVPTGNRRIKRAKTAWKPGRVSAAPGYRAD